MNGLWNMTLFLMIVNLLGALIAVQLFRGDVPADTHMNFGETYTAFLAMYQVLFLPCSQSWPWLTGVIGVLIRELDRHLVPDSRRKCSIQTSIDCGVVLCWMVLLRELCVHLGCPRFLGSDFCPKQSSYFKCSLPSLTRYVESVLEYCMSKLTLNFRTSRLRKSKSGLVNSMHTFARQSQAPLKSTGWRNGTRIVLSRRRQSLSPLKPCRQVSFCR